MKDDCDGVFGKATARSYPLYLGTDGPRETAAVISAKASDSYSWTFAKGLVNEGMSSALAGRVGTSVAAVLKILHELGAPLGHEPKVAGDLRGRIAELGLSAMVKYPEDPKQRKHFAKLAKKIQLEDNEKTLATFTDATFLGVYGLILTSRAVRSRDLGEDPVLTPWESVEPMNVAPNAANGKQLMVAPGAVHELPQSLTLLQVEAVADLVREFAAGSVT
ncbi:hypothetical protein [Paeniglutamicibacter antarcticus]|uniref:Uncharacterized protein n=1 Tax=Paeniglutamicibacter antarcticus TaxID=494023 RepID=A0ABP9TSU7_9MICC